MPILASRSTWSVAVTQPGPASIPTVMKGTINGWCSRTPIAPMTAVVNSSAAISKKNTVEHCSLPIMSITGTKITAGQRFG